MDSHPTNGGSIGTNPIGTNPIGTNHSGIISAGGGGVATQPPPQSQLSYPRLPQSASSITNGSGGTNTGNNNNNNNVIMNGDSNGGNASSSTATTGRPRNERPIVKLSLSLIDTYRRINEVYYEERGSRRRNGGGRGGEDRRNPTTAVEDTPAVPQQQQQQPPHPQQPTQTTAQQQLQTQQLQQQQQQEQQTIQQQVTNGNAAHARPSSNDHERGPGVNNNGWDDEHYDYIFTQGETFGRYVLQERIGKGSFGQVVRALDTVLQTDVAIKIIKSKKPFQLQARTEIDLLTHLRDRDRDDENNIVRLLSHFMYKNHQCLVFEMLSLNLYELLKNTQFKGVSLKLIRKFAKQILEALKFLARPDVDVIHCDLKPENILLRNPNKSGVKVIDFGSSCRSNRRMYSYIQSRFYRSPEVMLGLPYSVAIDMWSLGCILVEMLTGEPLFSGSDQFDQMQKIVKILGMLPEPMLDMSIDTTCSQFFERDPHTQRWVLKSKEGSERVAPSTDPILSLGETIGTDSKSTPHDNSMFHDLIHRMLAYRPEDRITPDAAMQHPFILATHHTVVTEASTRSSYSPLRQRPDP